VNAARAPQLKASVGCLEDVMIDLLPNQNDDAQFVALASRLLNSLIALHCPTEIYVIQIDHWFDHKWQYFSGKTIGAVGMWRSTVTIPPFDPGRVVSQNYFRAEGTSPVSYKPESAKPLHLDQWSGHNLHRFIKQVSSSGLFLWYSGETEKMDRAAVMVYAVQGCQTVPWYASFMKRDGWMLNKVKGISRLQFDEMVA
jgi:hypothetical protein